MPRKRLPWFKVWVGATRHEKVAMLDDRTFRVWVELLDAASQQTVRGQFASTAAAASVIRRPLALVKILIQAHLIDQTADGAIQMHDWPDWQRWRPEDAPSDPDPPPESHTIDSRMTPESLINPNGITRENQAIDTRKPSRGAERAKTEKKKGEVEVDVEERRKTKDVTPSTTSTDPKAAAAALISEMASTTWPSDAAELHDAVQTHLGLLGFNCVREFRVADRGDGRPGKVDLIAERDDCRLAIEIDRATPREKSSVKLAQVADAVRIVLLRGLPRDSEIPEGVDLIGFLPSPHSRPKGAAAAEFSDEERLRINAIGEALAHFGISDDPLLWRKVLDTYGQLDLEAEALKQADWMHRHHIRACTSARYLNWLSKARAAALPMLEPEEMPTVLTETNRAFQNCSRCGIRRLLVVSTKPLCGACADITVAA